MIDYEKRVAELEEKVHDLRWRVNQISNHLMIDEEPCKPKASCCSVHSGGDDEREPVCEHESDGITYSSCCEGMVADKCKKCGEFFR
jgi:hypothetical protein